MWPNRGEKDPRENQARHSATDLLSDGDPALPLSRQLFSLRASVRPDRRRFDNPAATAVDETDGPLWEAIKTQIADVARPKGVAEQVTAQLLDRPQHRIYCCRGVRQPRVKSGKTGRPSSAAASMTNRSGLGQKGNGLMPILLRRRLCIGRRNQGWFRF
jgi:hypothetical protein